MALAPAAASLPAVAASCEDTARLSRLITACGFAVVDSTTMYGLLGGGAEPLQAGSPVAGGASPADATVFADSWNDLPLDGYMADGGRYRRRRHAMFTADETGALTRQRHQPHYQSRRDNPLNGGIARWFAPVFPAISEGPTLRSAIRLLVSVANGVRLARAAGASRCTSSASRRGRGSRADPRLKGCTATGWTSS